MSKPTIAGFRVSRKPSTANVQAPATVADVALAATLITSARAKKGWVADPRLVETFSNPLMQGKLRGASKELAVVGIDVEQLLECADEGAPLLAALLRLNESTGRVQQRLVELNKRIKSGQTRLIHAHQAAAPSTTLAQALQGLVGLRANQVIQAKRSRTRTKKRKKGAARPSTPS
jgi:hypothetical protein